MALVLYLKAATRRVLIQSGHFVSGLLPTVFGCWWNSFCKCLQGLFRHSLCIGLFVCWCFITRSYSSKRTDYLCSHSIISFREGRWNENLDLCYGLRFFSISCKSHSSNLVPCFEHAISPHLVLQYIFIYVSQNDVKRSCCLNSSSAITVYSNFRKPFRCSSPWRFLPDRQYQ